jgi:hypothetical protein
MQRHEILAVLTKHELPLPIHPSEAADLPVQRIHMNGADRVELIFLGTGRVIHIKHDRRTFTIPAAGLSEHRICELEDYCRALDQDGRHGLAADAEDEFARIRRAELAADRERRDRKNLAYLIGKYGPEGGRS